MASCPLPFWTVTAVFDHVDHSVLLLWLTPYWNWLIVSIQRCRVTGQCQHVSRHCYDLHYVWAEKYLYPLKTPDYLWWNWIMRWDIFKILEKSERPQIGLTLCHVSSQLLNWSLELFGQLFGWIWVWDQLLMFNGPALCTSSWGRFFCSIWTVHQHCAMAQHSSFSSSIFITIATSVLQ